jgi:nascent polypeptide-associated complex subunit alpha
MIPGMNSRQLKQAMKKMGMQQEQLDAQEVIIRLADRDLIINDPEVAKVNMMGQETFQIVGTITESTRDATPDIDEEDVQTVVESTGASSEEARETIIRAQGDLAQAILELKENHE